MTYPTGGALKARLPRMGAPAFSLHHATLQIEVSDTGTPCALPSDAVV